MFFNWIRREEDERFPFCSGRLFEHIDVTEAKDVVSNIFAMWDRNKETLADDAFSEETRKQFRSGYPLHPETLNVMIEKMSSLEDFQRTRGMLRILARTVF